MTTDGNKGHLAQQGHRQGERRSYPARTDGGSCKPALRAGIGLQRRCPEGKSQKNTPTYDEQESKLEIPD
jgi:hypothetical protein